MTTSQDFADPRTPGFLRPASLYWENKLSLYNAAYVSRPGCRERLSRRELPGPAQLDGTGDLNLIYYNKPDKGGHFAAWEQAQVFSEEVRAGFRPLRK